MQIPFLCSLDRIFLATIRVYTFLSRIFFGKGTYFRIVQCKVNNKKLISKIEIVKF